MRMKKLEILALERGYSLSRKNKEIKWTRNNNGAYGISYTVKDAYEDILLDYQGRLNENSQRRLGNRILGRKCG